MIPRLAMAFLMVWGVMVASAFVAATLFALVELFL